MLTERYFGRLLSTVRKMKRTSGMKVKNPGLLHMPTIAALKRKHVKVNICENGRKRLESFRTWATCNKQSISHTKDHAT